MKCLASRRRYGIYYHMALWSVGPHLAQAVSPESYVIDAKANTRNLLDGELITIGQRSCKPCSRIGRKPASCGTSRSAERMVAKVAAHRQAVEAAGAEVDAILGQLQGAERTFFEVNFIAQRQILLGLQQWFEGVLQAGLAEQKNDRPAVVRHLQAAQAGMATIRNAQTLCTQGKWRDWYRGERKMNLGRSEDLTRQALDAAK